MKKFCAVCRFFLCCSCLTGMPFSGFSVRFPWNIFKNTVPQCSPLKTKMLSYSKARISGLTAIKHAPKSNFTRSHNLTVGDLGTRLKRAEASLCTWGPKNFEKGQARKLKCDFKAPVHEVYWYKDNELITNGTEGLYQFYDQLDDDTLRSTLHFLTVHVNHEGIYTCKADTSQNSSCPEGLTVEVSVFCARGHITAANKLVYAEQFSNRSLKCSALTPSDCSFGQANLQWYYRNRTLQSGGKYIIKEHKSSECRRRLLQAEFILEIYNVTAHDAGEYFCQMECISFFTTTEIDSIELVTLLKPPETTDETTLSRAVASQLPPRRHVAKWIVPVMCGAVFAIILAAVCVLKKGKNRRNGRYKLNRHDDVLNNKLFISYSSKDYSWVTENLIPLLDKHSIPFSIHIRDFELGKPIVQNMADSVYNSRQVLIVLSDNYLASNFCREELHMAVQRGVNTGDSSLILVMIDKFKKSRLPGALRKTTLLDFEKHKRKQDWEKKLIDVVIDAKYFSV